MRVYASKYPGEIVGMAFLDASHPRQIEMEPIAKLQAKSVSFYTLMKWCARLSLIRLYSPLFKHFSPEAASEEIEQQLKRMLRHPAMYETMRADLEYFEISAAQCVQAGDLVDMPVVVLTGPEKGKLPDDINREEWLRLWSELQEQLVTLSTNGRHKVIEGASYTTLVTGKHYAGQVADEILALVVGQ